MFEIEIVCIGKLNQKFYKDGCAEYLKRLSSYYRVLVTELAEFRPRGEGDSFEKQVVEEEGKLIRRRLEMRSGPIAALCIEGSQMNSKEWADKLREFSATASRVRLAIGGSHGLSETIKEMAHERISLAKMTMTHQLTRLVLLEQFYRAATIITGAKYHK